MIDGHTGACFAFGVFVDGHFLEGSLTYVVGVIQVRMVTNERIKTGLHFSSYPRFIQLDLLLVLSALQFLWGTLPSLENL